MKVIIPFLSILFLFSCSPEQPESFLEQSEVSDLRAHIPGDCQGMALNIYYDPSLVPYEEVRNVRNQYFNYFGAWLCFPSEQPTDHYHDIWYVMPGNPEGNGSLGDVLDQDPRVGTTPP